MCEVAIREPLRSETVGAVERFCENRVPVHARGEVRIDYVVRGNSITLRECRAPWREEYGPEWSVNPRAQLRFDPGTGLWALYRPDRNVRWRRYADAQPTGAVDWLLREIDLDSHGAFWG
jgi:hypothetical protein